MSKSETKVCFGATDVLTFGGHHYRLSGSLGEGIVLETGDDVFREVSALAWPRHPKPPVGQPLRRYR
jgi:hypothetical protein